MGQPWNRTEVLAQWGIPPRAKHGQWDAVAPGPWFPLRPAILPVANQKGGIPGGG